MEFKKINDKKVRILLSDQDLISREIELRDFRKNTPKAEELIYDLIDEIEDMDLVNFKELNVYGFDVSVAEILRGPFIIEINIVAKNEEGKTLNDFLDKLKKQNKEDTSEDNFSELFEEINKTLKNTSRPKLKAKVKTLPILIYKFTNIENIIELSKSYNWKRIINSLYTYKDNYYLLINPKNNKEIDLHISEFGDKMSNEVFTEALLYERGKELISKNALQKIKKMY
jgi:negative regulator of genetic competence, sporulation and motility